MLITKKNIKDRFDKNLKWAEEIDIAVAWATPHKSINNKGLKNKRVRAIVGLSGNITHPQALRKLKEIGELRLVHGSPLFHPKVYIFRNKGKSVAWIGSANFTGGGFGGNEEVMVEVSSTGSIDNWFEKRFLSLKKATSKDISDYEKRRKVNPPPPIPLFFDSPTALLKDASSWTDYVRALEKCNEWWRRDYNWSVLEPSHSYIHTIKVGFKLIRKDWFSLSNDEIRCLLGIGREDGDWGLLGSMQRASLAKRLFLERHKDKHSVLLSEMQQEVRVVMNAGEKEFPHVAVEAFAKMTDNKGIGEGVATRLLALARPSHIVSVNRASRKGLAEVFDLSESTLGSKKNYQKLLSKIYKEPWFNERKPVDKYEQEIWSMRVALIDSFVYRPKSK